MTLRKIALLSAAALALTSCGGENNTKTTQTNDQDNAVAFASTYKPMPSETTLITNAFIIDGAGGEIENGSILITDGRITAIGTDIDGGEAVVVDAGGKFVTPGIIDIHSHLGNYPSPSVRAHNDGNEITSPVTSEVFAEHGVWPQDPGFDEALEGGITTLHILPGSANLFGENGVRRKSKTCLRKQGRPRFSYGQCGGLSQKLD